MEKISDFRKKIDEIDEEILLLLKERIEVSKLIGQVKRKSGAPIRDIEREKEKYEQVLKKAVELGLNLNAVKNVYENIIAMSIQAQEQSPPSAKSHAKVNLEKENANSLKYP